MQHEDRHVSDQELMLALDGELSARRTEEIQAHVTACWTCRARRAEIESAIEDFVRAHHGHLDSRLPSADGPRALLKARLAEMSGKAQPAWSPWPLLVFRHRGLAYACVAVLLAGMGAARLLTLRRHSPEPAGRTVELGPRFVPDPRLTPGATVLLTQEQVCSGRGAEQVHFIPASEAGKVFEEYGIANPRPRTYEVDYLITPELGGSNDLRNVWPQPYSNAIWNAHLKDALEDHLHQLVCEGKLDLGTAQHDIARDWVSAYKKYFHTDTPLPTHLAFAKDRPWE